TCKSEGGSLSYSQAMKKTIAVVAFCVLAGLSSASAQTPGAPTIAPGSAQSIDEVRQDYRIHAGPFHVNPTVLLKELGVDTNVFNAAGEQQSDFTFTVTTQADIAVAFARRGLLRTTVGADVVYYAIYDSERSLDPSVRLRGEAYARRLTLFAEGDYLNTRQRPNYEIDLRSRHVENNVMAGAGVRLSSKPSFELAARRGRTDYDAGAGVDGTRLQQTLQRQKRRRELPRPQPAADAQPRDQRRDRRGPLPPVAADQPRGEVRPARGRLRVL